MGVAGARFAVIAQTRENGGATLSLIAVFTKCVMHPISDRNCLCNTRRDGADDSITRNPWQFFAL
jgi:hypothetical protein